MEGLVERLIPLRPGAPICGGVRPSTVLEHKANNVRLRGHLARDLTTQTNELSATNMLIQTEITQRKVPKLSYTKHKRWKPSVN
jgi:hypothetical protein